MESRLPTAAAPQVTGAVETLKRGAVQTLEGLRGGQEMEERRGRAILLPMCFEFRPGWTQCWLFSLERPLVNSLSGLLAGGLERCSWCWA